MGDSRSVHTWEQANEREYGRNKSNKQILKTSLEFYLVVNENQGGNTA